MKLPVTLLIAVIVVLTISSTMLAQESGKRQAPEIPAEILGPQLIAWSHMQDPQPVYGSESQENSASPADGPTASRQSQSAASRAPQQPTAEQTLTGTIVKDGSRCMLKVSDGNSYELDDQDRAKSYEGKQVRIAGTLDGGSGTFHVIRIESIS